MGRSFSKCLPETRIAGLTGEGNVETVDGQGVEVGEEVLEDVSDLRVYITIDVVPTFV